MKKNKNMEVGMLRIVTDGTADMPKEWLSKYDIYILSQGVYFRNGEQIEQFDFENNDFYEAVKSKKTIPQTSFNPPDQIIEFYRKITKKGDSILSIHASSKLSGTLSAFRTAAKELGNEIKINVFDSLAGSAVLGFMCRDARMLSQNGFSTEEIIEKLEGIRKKINVTFTVDTLEFAHFSGRVNALQNAIASMLNIKPIIILKDGLLEMKEKVRTRKAALNKILLYAVQQIGSKIANVAVVHAKDEETAGLLAEQLKSMKICKEIIIMELSIPVAAHLGPGTVGIVVYPV